MPGWTPPPPRRLTGPPAVLVNVLLAAVLIFLAWPKRDLGSAPIGRFLGTLVFCLGIPLLIRYFITRRDPQARLWSPWLLAAAIGILLFTRVVPYVGSIPDESGDGSVTESSESDPASDPVDAESAFVDLGPAFEYRDAARRVEEAARRRFERETAAFGFAFDLDVANIVDVERRKIVAVVSATSFEPQLDGPGFREDVFRGFSSQGEDVEETEVDGQKVVMVSGPAGDAAAFFDEHAIFVNVIARDRSTALEIGTLLIEASREEETA